MQANTDYADKRIDCKATRFYAPVPALWAKLGRQARDLDGRATFYAESVCVESHLLAEREGPGRVTHTELVDLWVCYRNPATGECVERQYSGATVETGNRAVAVDCPDVDGDYHRIAYPGVRPDEECGYVVLPKTVHAGEPANFRASIDVHPDETRIAGGL